MNLSNKLKNKKGGSISPNTLKRLSPKTFLKTVIFEEMPLVKRNKKIPCGEFKIPKYNEYKLLLGNNYNCCQLKSICRFYKLKISGNKKELNYRVWNYLKYSGYSVKIQSFFRGFLIRHLNFYKQINLKDHTNRSDFMTLENINNIPYYQIIKYKDKCDFVYVFDLCSLYNLYLNSLDMEKNISDVNNPFNRKKLPVQLYDDMKRVIKLSKILNYNLKLKIDKVEQDDLTEKKKIELKMQDLFQKIDNLGFITDLDWFNTLNKRKIVRFLRELIDIWEYRAQINNFRRREICPPTGNPFSNVSFNFLLQADTISHQRILLNVIEKLVCNGINEGARYSGTVFVLGCFTIVNQNAANSLPWLYETFLPQHAP
jgi:hypothetical protein